MAPRPALALSLFLAVIGRGAVRAADAPAAGAKEERGALYQAGLDQYSRGDRAGALKTFRESARRDPEDRFARAAVRRLEAELAVQAAESGPTVVAEEYSRLDGFLLVKLPRWYHFERTIGDPLSSVGTVTALNARVRQLMGERAVALAKGRRFRKNRELRELLRRAPLAAKFVHPESYRR